MKIWSGWNRTAANPTATRGHRAQHVATPALQAESEVGTHCAQQDPAAQQAIATIGNLKNCSGICIFSPARLRGRLGPDMSTVLIVEDDKRLGPTIQKGLAEQDFNALLAASGETALAMVRKQSPDIIVLDLGLPDIDGIDLLNALRGQAYGGPVLILTARDGLTDKVLGLDTGADDYMVKPFAFSELLARLRALLRRSPAAARVLSVGSITIDLVTRHVMHNDQSIDLTPREFDLLAYLAQHAGQVVSREMLAEHVWRESNRFTPLDNVIDVHVSRLRRKLTAVAENNPLQVIRGQGIMLGGGE